MKAAVVILLLVCVLLARAYWVACRKIDRRDTAIAERDALIVGRDAQIASLRAELTLTQQACDRQTVKARHMLHQAQGYRAEVTRLSARVAELRDQVDGGREPTLTEEFLAWLAEEPITYPEDQR
ncbi:hypothetical protein [Micromonospora tarensis]|uniref:Uncharacterized protein n=1 Tax=Micromonospora tarensis TaxID=2806100 RepID=A0ABS1YD77_9ACTN|nr:hypothetical protein [Micromonospora tarensis]MBM0275360.1 hypothetical protein [Micromonospora tarensis]